MANQADSNEAEKSSVPSLGAILKNARESANYGIEQLAGQLHLDPAVLRALETEDFAALGAPVYVRGHLKALARILDINPEQLLTAYEQLVPAEPDVMVSRGPQPPKPSNGNPLLWVFVVLAVLLGGFIGYWLVSEPDAEPTGSLQQKPLVSLAGAEAETIAGRSL